MTLENETHMTIEQMEFAIAQEAASLDILDTVEIIMETPTQVEFQMTNGTAIWMVKGQMDTFSVARKGDEHYIDRQWEELTADEKLAVGQWEE